MLQRIKIYYLLFRVRNSNPAIHRPAMNALIEIGKPAIKLILRQAISREMLLYRITYTIVKPHYQMVLKNLPHDESVNNLVEYFERLAKERHKSQVLRERWGEILASIGLESWNLILQLAEQSHKSMGSRVVYFMLPYFANHIPLLHFVEVSQNHPNIAIRAQATLVLMQNENPLAAFSVVLDNLKRDHHDYFFHDYFPDYLGSVDI